MKRALPFLALAACDLPEKGLPSDFPDITPFAACVSPDGGWPDDQAWNQVAELRGTVLEIGVGDAVDCADSYRYLSAGSVDITNASWLRLEDETSGGLWEVAVVLSSFALDFEVGEEVRVDWAFQPPEFSSGVGSLLLADFEAAPVLWMGQAWTLEEIVPPDGVFFARGDAIALQEDGCGTVEAYDLGVTTEDDEGTVPYGESAMVGGVIVHHGGLSDALEVTNDCIDWWAGGATLAVSW